MGLFMTRAFAGLAQDWARHLGKPGVLGVALVAACGLGCSGPRDDAGPDGAPPSVAAEAPQAATQPFDPVAPGASVVCGVTKTPTGLEPELYQVSAMNRKLALYPEFASATGMSLISDCDGAREFKRKYVEYSLSHEGFDADQPLGEMPEPTSHEAPPPASSDTQKILNGMASQPQDNPVVELLLKVPPNPDPSWGEPGGEFITCSGTFINKNWILTAAHCVTPAAIYGCLKSHKSVAACRPDWAGAYAPYTVRGSWGPGHVRYELQNVWLEAYVYGEWEGRSNWTIPECKDQTQPGCYVVASGAKHDLALLYVNSGSDGLFTPNVDEDGAKRLSIIPPDLTSWAPTMRFEGWGGPDNTVDVHQRVGTPRASFGADMLLLAPKDGQKEGQIIVGSPVKGLTPFPCEGDSGGPLLRTGLEVASHGRTQTKQQAILGVASARSYAPGVKVEDCTVTPPHDDYVGDFAFWTRVDTAEHQKFITRTIKRWPPYKTMDCYKQTILPLASPDEVEECWGKVCSKDADCDDTEYCSLPSVGLTCSVCGPGAGCDCVKGQCATIPKK